MQINLIRHGKTKANLEGKFCGITETELIQSKFEIKQTILDKIKLYEIGKVFVSPRERAIKTAESISDNFNIIDELDEINFGIFEDKTFEEINKDFPKETKEWIEIGDSYKFPNGESLYEFYNRCIKAFNIIVDKNKDEEYITIFAHSGVIKVILSYVLSNGLELFWKIKIDNCSLSSIEYCDNNFVVSKVNL